MRFKTNDVSINYINYGNKNGEVIVFLHGWGQNIEMMKFLSDYFQDEYNLIVVDLPGFGKSTEPTYPWTVYDYSDAINTLLNSLNIKNPIMVGHSFGGKISLVYASKYNVKKLVLLASPFKKNNEKPTLFTKTLKTLMKVPGLKTIGNKAKKYIGSTDYKNSSAMMREVLVRTVNKDVVDEAKLIKSPTLLIWGTLDTAVPLSHAYELEGLIKDSAVIKFENATHYAYLEKINEVVNILKSFFKE